MFKKKTPKEWFLGAMSDSGKDARNFADTLRTDRQLRQRTIMVISVFCVLGAWLIVPSIGFALLEHVVAPLHEALHSIGNIAVH